MFIIDFDDTLLDTQAYKKLRIEEMEKIGVTPNIFEETYNQVYFSYTHERHAQALAEHGFPYEASLKILDDCLTRVGQFFFPDAEDFLSFLKTLGQPMVLLSFGVKEIQEYKLQAIGLTKYFDQVFTTVGKKEDILNQLIKNDKDVWFFNDKVGETLKIKSSFPNLKIVLKRCLAYPEIDYKNSGLPYFDTLTEIKEYVKQHQ